MAHGLRNRRRGVLEEPKRAPLLLDDLEATAARLPRNVDGASTREAETDAISESQSGLFGSGGAIEGRGDALLRLRRVWR
mmetsp:Transcript_34487/g.84475  ORF Transcript_34487/g.84475 Transcript_34487/m.84475 type:complete len:80 (+) Transcript_34487:50-289(+)